MKEPAHPGRPPGMPRVVGVLGVAFVLGSFGAASSLEEAYEYSSARRASEATEKGVDDLVWKLARGVGKTTMPAEAQPHADTARHEILADMLKRRPVLEAISITNFFLGTLLALFAAQALRLRSSGRTWLLQAACAGIAFALVQIVLGGAQSVQQMRILSPYLSAIGVGIDTSAWPYYAALPRALVGGMKIAFLLYLVVVLRRPQVRALYLAAGR